VRDASFAQRNLTAKDARNLNTFAQKTGVVVQFAQRVTTEDGHPAYAVYRDGVLYMSMDAIDPLRIAAVTLEQLSDPLRLNMPGIMKSLGVEWSLRTKPDPRDPYEDGYSPMYNPQTGEDEVFRDSYYVKKALAHADEMIASQAEGGDAAGGAAVEAESTLKPPELMDELARSGVKYTPEDVLMVVKTPDGKLMWLEQGNDSTGLTHIAMRHADEFISKGISSAQIPEFLRIAVTNGKIIGMQGTRPIYEVVFNGQIYRVAITIANNGFIVGANMR
jgi:hypothetical protein